MTTPPRRIAALFLVALAGVAVAVGIVVAELGGTPLLAGYCAVLLLLVGFGVARSRRAAAPAPRPTHCTCCDGDHTAPVRVV